MDSFGLDLGVDLHVILRWLAITFGIGYGLS